MKILFLSAWFPYPANNGSKLRIFNLLRGLSQTHEVILISFSDQPDPDTTELNKICSAVHIVPWEEKQLSSVNKLIARFSSTPISFLQTHSQQMVDQIANALGHHEIDLVIASQIKTASYGKYFRGLPALFEEIELGVMYGEYVDAKSWFNRIRYGLTWFKHKRFLKELMKSYDFCSFASTEEKQLFHTHVPWPDVKSKVIPNGVDVNQYVSYHDEVKPNSLIYTGAFGFYSNYEAMVWFVGEVLPLIQQQIPDVTLIITGDHKNLPLPRNSAVTQTGFVEDIRPLVAKTQVSIAPLLTGGGTRLKILEAMALKTAVVATSKGAQGLDAESGLQCLIADSPAEFSAAVVKLLKDDEQRRLLEENGFRLAKSTYDWSAILPKFEEIIQCITK